MVCKGCGATNPDDAVACPKCGAPAEPVPDARAVLPSTHVRTPPHRSYVPLWAACILVFFVFAVAGATLLGWALWMRKARPGPVVRAPVGVRMALRCQTERLPAGEVWDANKLEIARQVVERRAQFALPPGATVRSVPPGTLVVEAPGQGVDVDRATAALTTPARLEFRYVPELDPGGTWTTRPETAQGAGGLSEIGFEAIVDQQGQAVTQDELQARVFATDAVATSDQFKPNAAADVTNGHSMLHFELQDAVKPSFEDFTRTHVGKTLAIFLDGRLVTAPRLQAAIPGQGVIEGRFPALAAATLANQLNAGALPVPLEVATVERIGPSARR